MKLIVSICIFLCFIKSYNQDIEKHQWQNRVLLILTNDINSNEFNKQIKTFSDRNRDLEERKLIIYKVVSLGNDFKHKDKLWVNNKVFFDTYKRTNKVLEVVLIGLDGGVKLRQTKYLTPEKLFAIIDGMPMRKSELKSKKY